MKEYLDSLKEALDKVSVEKGDILYVASDITRVINECRKNATGNKREYRDKCLNDIVDILKESVGEEGTLLFPVFTWTFCRGQGFDIRSTKGEVGAFNNWILENRTDFRRTRHPLYSFMVWGKDTEYLRSFDNQSAWGKDSIFQYLYDNHAKMLFLDVTIQRGYTFMHFVEQSVEVPYRYHKYFLSEYTDEKGNTYPRCYSQYVLDLDIQNEEYLPDEFLDSKGITKTAETTIHPIKLLDMYASYDVLANDFKENGGANCYHFTDYTIDWEKGHTHAHEISDRLSE